MKAVIVAGVRTPFARAGTVFKDFSAIDLGSIAVRELMDRVGLPGEEVDQLVYGTVVHDPHAPNIAREVGLATLPPSVPAHTVSRACATSNQAIADAANLIEVGYADVVVTGGAESLSHIPIMVSERLSETLVAASKARTVGDRVKTIARVRPKDLLPRAPQIAEPTTGETMGESAERMAKENGISRADQDAWALRSHQKAGAGTDDGRLTAEIARVYLPPDFDPVVERDNGIRTDTSAEKLASLKPVFDRRYGSVTAGNASPLTDGASAVLLMSEERARADGLPILGRIRSYAVAALDPADQLLQGPVFAVPTALKRAGIQMRDIGLMEMHEAFAAQVLSNLQWLDSDRVARERLGLSAKVGHPDVDRINVMGGSLAIGHPFAATGGRLTTTLLNEMVRRDVELGLLTVCAAGALGLAMVVERV
ncbi:MAG: acetyl-CoA C-acyltransferase FadI [Gemmatimonadetes bacterium]|nr:acetyl-CoA C-acyltransferase FadI [Gemmatimonadota bacterium]NNF39015.1 acetyl-CoA C-acyltransferase FadI [Gemmatimonadota bacterium]